MPHDTTQEEEKPRHEKEAETHRITPPDITKEKEELHHEDEFVINQEKERENTELIEENPDERSAAQKSLGDVT